LQSSARGWAQASLLATFIPREAASPAFQYVTLSQPHTGSNAALSPGGRFVQTPFIPAQLATLQ
jgi:hypothetical protein